jgi:MFS transporter, ACS family, hexuronate transporter
LGAVLIGWLVDRWNVRWIYSTVVLLWSLAGFLTGFAQGFISLLICRLLLGLAESGNWPCGLRTTQRILTPSERTMGNSLLQSGAALGAVLTPLFVLGLFQWTGTWRYSFMIVGAFGVIWVAGWMVSVRREDLELSEVKPAPSLFTILGWLVFCYGIDLVVHIYFDRTPTIPLAVKLVVTTLGIVGVAYWLAGAIQDKVGPERTVFFRRFWVLAVMVVTINITWHFFRAWLPLFLQNQHGYSLAAFSWFSLAYYLATDIGSLSAGFATLFLARRGLLVHTSRLLVFSACAMLTALSTVAAVLPTGWVLLGVLLVIGFASLGLYPNYYSFSQELTIRHQGKLTGALSCICWMMMSLLHEVVGDMVQWTGSYSQGVACAGLLPLLGVVAMLLFWGGSAIPQPEIPADDTVLGSYSDGVQIARDESIRPAATDPPALSSPPINAIRP